MKKNEQSGILNDTVYKQNVLKERKEEKLKYETHLKITWILN